jgi:SAM-dependent methyltransferase
MKKSTAQKDIHQKEDWFIRMTTPKHRRPFRHLTFRYLIDRVRDRCYQAVHPSDPWLTPLAIQFLAVWLKPTDRGLEFGSGRSTLWFACRAAALTSVEHAPAWHARVSRQLADQQINNVDYHLIACKEDGKPEAYTDIAAHFAADSLDFCLVDGIYRDACVLAVIEKLKPGGLLVIDDAHRYLPSHSIAPYARSQAQGPASPLWGEFLSRCGSWRCLWSS